MIPIKRLIFLCCALFSIQHIDALEPKNNDNAIKTQESKIDGIPYEIKFKGVLSSDVKDSLKNVSMLVRLSERLPSSITGLGKRAEKDKKKFKKVLMSKGYLGSKVSFRISEKENKAVVKFTIDLGKVYKVSSIEIESTDNPSFFKGLSRELVYDILNLSVKDDVDFETILDSVRELKSYLNTQGYPNVLIEKPIGYVEHKLQKLKVIFKVHTGILARIKSTQIVGLKNVHEVFLRNRLLWKDGDIYNLETIEKTKSELAKTQLIGSTVVEIIPLDLRDCVLDQKENPIPQDITFKIAVKEALPRSIGVGLNYSLTEKLGGNFYWHHNNFFGGQEHVGVSFKYFKYYKRLKFSYDLLDFMAPLQKLSSEIVLKKEENPLSYDGQTQMVSSILTRPISNFMNFNAGFGIELERANLKQDKFSQESNLNFIDKHSIIGLPIIAGINTVSNETDPASGRMAYLKLTSYFGQMVGVNRILRVEASLSHYLSLSKSALGKPIFVIALFAKCGKILMKNKVLPPLNKRFFAGGPSSVRGYAADKLSPYAEKENKNDIIFLGGRSLVEFKSEIRYRFNHDWGGVLFADAAMVTSPVKGGGGIKKQKILWGPGFGIRYFTKFAPICVDFAFPAKRRKTNSGKNIDSLFQFYISIGQSF